jgi:hypothetical protein
VWAMARHAKDGVAKADFALHSGGAVVTPSLTSEGVSKESHNRFKKLSRKRGGI